MGILSTARINRLVRAGARRSDRMDVIAVASRDWPRAEAYAREYSIGQAYGSYDALLEDPAVRLALPPVVASPPLEPRALLDRDARRRSLHLTRHYFGWYAFNVLGLLDHVIAHQFGHRDGGKLVRATYGHPDAAIARERIREAFRSAPAPPIPLVATGR